MTHIPPLLLAVILSSSLLTFGSAEASIFCTWKKVLPTEEVHYMFLQTSPSLRLYHSSWSGGRAPLACAWSDDASVIQNYLSLCRERANEFSDVTPDENFNSMFEAKDPCVSMASPNFVLHTERTGRRSARSAGDWHEDLQGEADRSEVKTLQRSKRFIIPGTLWCGSGNKAPSNDDLGVFADTDSCCREHDHCKHTIMSFHSGFGVFNTNMFTISHCDCDNRFHKCLKEANDSMSDVVGYTFFNLLKVQCFEFSHRVQCTQRNWFGMCKETSVVLYAKVHPPTAYESSTVTHTNSTSGTTNTTAPTESPEDSTSQSELLSVTASASTIPTLLTHSPSTLNTPTTLNTPDGTPGPVTEDRDHQQSTESTKNQTTVDADITETKLSCAAFKDLDQCKNKILPLHTRYGVKNPDTTTMYHCNCTSRLFQTLTRQRQLTIVQTQMLGHVSSTCFLPQDCRTSKICSAVLVEAKFPQMNRSSSGVVEEQRHLPAVSLKVRRTNIRRDQRKDRKVRLHKLCLRMVRTKFNRSRKPRPSVRRREVV
ncbi:group 3 secretory phospholipase A2 isoform X2 [Antennarius striatus]|uniref:group 3 secretory phospholipase A2 isoform X2 n=1 Tax=Antennarius striatus TaxID=241820 RepID=UPI0035AF53E3